jgi:hypothetical protein
LSIYRAARSRSLSEELHIESSDVQSFRFRRRRALVITDTELKLMAAAAKMGLSSQPKMG